MSYQPTSEDMRRWSKNAQLVISEGNQAERIKVVELISKFERFVGSSVMFTYYNKNWPERPYRNVKSFWPTPSWVARCEYLRLPILSWEHEPMSHETKMVIADDFERHGWSFVVGPETTEVNNMVRMYWRLGKTLLGVGFELSKLRSAQLQEVLSNKEMFDVSRDRQGFDDGLEDWKIDKYIDDEAPSVHGEAIR